MDTVKRHPLAWSVPAAFLLVPLALCFYGCGESKVQRVRCYAIAPPSAPGDAGLDATAASDAGSSAEVPACVPANRAFFSLNVDESLAGATVDEGPVLVPADAGPWFCCYLVTFTDSVAAADP
jgi:hypothetical protein